LNVKNPVSVLMADLNEFKTYFAKNVDRPKTLFFDLDDALVRVQADLDINNQLTSHVL
jgi:hypothetical protein